MINELQAFFNTQIALKANISDMYYKADVYTQTQMNELFNIKLKSSENSDFLMMKHTLTHH